MQNTTTTVLLLLFFTKSRNLCKIFRDCCVIKSQERSTISQILNAALLIPTSMLFDRTGVKDPDSFLNLKMCGVHHKECICKNPLPDYSTKMYDQKVGSL